MIYINLMRKKGDIQPPLSVLLGVLALLALLAPLALAQTTNVPPAITEEPTSQTVLLGNTATFQVAAAGTSQFGYQWQFNGTNLPDDIIITVAGDGSLGFSGDGGAATNAGIAASGVAVDASGNLFVADNSNNRVRKVDVSGVIITVAGNGQSAYSGDGGAATNAGLNFPSAVALDASGNLFIADQNNNRVRKVDTNGVITTVAGNGSSNYSGDGGAATKAGLNLPSGVAVDSSGTLFISDQSNHRVRKVNAHGVISTVAGNGSPTYSGDGGAAQNASLNYPCSLTLDSSGNLFIADEYNSRIRRVDTSGVITTVAGGGFTNGNGFGTYGGDGGLATKAGLAFPRGVTVNLLGELFIADYYDNRIRKVDAAGIITTVAGGGSSGDGSSAVNANLGWPAGVALDAFGHLFIAESAYNRVREVAFGGLPTLTLDSVSASVVGDYQVIVTSPYGSVTSAIARLTVLFPPSIVSQPTNLAVAVGGTALLGVAAMGTPPLSYAWDFNSTNLVQAGTNSTLSFANAGLPEGGNYLVVITNLYGSVTSAVATVSVGYSPSFFLPPTNQTVLLGGVATFRVEAEGTGPFSYQWQFNRTNLGNNIIRTVAGNGMSGYSGDGLAATNASLNGPYGVAVDATGDLFIADSLNHRIRKVDGKGIITTVTGDGRPGFSGDNGPATGAMLSDPSDVAVDSFGDIFIADNYNQRIREVDLNGIITTVAGNGSQAYSDGGGAAINASLNYPCGVAVDAVGNLFIADSFNGSVRKVDVHGVISTFAGNGEGGPPFGTGDGGLATSANLEQPTGVAVDASGNLFIADRMVRCIRKVSTNGVITTVAGGGSYLTLGDGGPATSASLRAPFDVAVDSAGNLFIADTRNNRIRKVDASGLITTVAGDGLEGDTGDGGAATNASLSGPTGVIVDSSGNLFIADNGNNRVREVALAEVQNLSFNNISAANAGDYQVIITSPYGSVTSAVATLTVHVPPMVVMNAPIISGSSLLLGFTFSQTSNASFALLQSPTITGPWTTNTSAILTTNAQTGSYQFALPVPDAVAFYQVRWL